MRTELAIVGALVLAGIEGTRAQGKVDFAGQIRPIIEARCVECHGPDKQKAKLRLDSRESAMKRDADVAVIVPGKAEESELYRRIILPAGHDDIMPNEGDPLTQAETDLIRDWINQGAEWPESAPAADTKDGGPTDPLAGLPTEFKAGANEAKAAAALMRLGVQVRPVAMNTHWTEANFRFQAARVDDAAIAPLKDVTSLTVLNLANTKITDAGLGAIEGLQYLTRLHLELTPITDAGLARLKGLRHLRYLNLYGTSVTDAGMEHLKALSELRHLYLWQTKVSEEGVKGLKAALPSLVVSTGAELQMPVEKEGDKPPEKKAEEKKEEK